jgi:hypothetical protein
MPVRALSPSQLFDQTASLGVLCATSAKELTRQKEAAKARDARRIRHLFPEGEAIAAATQDYFRIYWRAHVEHHCVLRFATALLNSCALYGSGLKVCQEADKKFLPGRGFRHARSRSEAPQQLIGVDAAHSSLVPGIRLVGKGVQTPMAFVIFNNVAVGLPQSINVRMDKAVEEGGCRKMLESNLQRSCLGESNPLRLTYKLVKRWSALLKEKEADWELLAQKNHAAPDLLVLLAAQASRGFLKALIAERSSTARWAMLLRLEVPVEQSALREALASQKGSLKSGLQNVHEQRVWSALGHRLRQTFQLPDATPAIEELEELTFFKEPDLLEAKGSPSRAAAAATGPQTEAGPST